MEARDVAQDGSDLIPEPASDDHVRGSLEAPVIITEFGDFECPYCGMAYGVLERVLEAYGPKVALVFRHFPLPMHPHAAAAAEAAEAAGDAGKFWEMYDTLYTHQQALDVEHLRAYGEGLGVAGEAIDDAIRKHTHRERIARDIRSGQESAIPGTPALFINGFAYDDEASVEALSDVIDRALAARDSA
jgi:protein-disulfide isomerase